MAKKTVQSGRAEKALELTALVRSKLGRLRGVLAERLGAVTAAPPPDGAAYLLFEIHEAHDRVTVCLYPMDRTHSTVDVDRKYFNDTLIERQFPDFDRIDWDGYRKSVGANPYPYIERELITLFVECWRGAGGTDYSIPAVIRWHDSSQKPIDLTSGTPAQDLP